MIFPNRDVEEQNLIPDCNNDLLPIDTVDFSQLLQPENNINAIDEMLDSFRSELEQHSIENFLGN